MKSYDEKKKFGFLNENDVCDFLRLTCVEFLNHNFFV